MIYNRLKMLFLTIATLMLLCVSLSTASANADSDGRKKSAPDMESVHQIERTAPEKHETSLERQQARTGGPATAILAFGCRLNYRLTDWALSDKCNSRKRCMRRSAEGEASR